MKNQIMRSWILVIGVLFLLAFTVSAMNAQEIDGKIGAGGVYYSADVPGSIGGFGVLAIPIKADGKLKSFSGFKVFGATETDPANLEIAGHRLRYSATTGFAYKIYQKQWFSVHALTDFGLESNGLDTGATTDLGGFFHFAINPRFGVMVIAAAQYSTIEDSWIVNPAVGLSVKF